MRTMKTLILVVVVLGAVLPASGAVIVPYDNKGQWSTALALYSNIQMFTETFDDGLVNQTGLSVSSDYPGYVSGFVWNDRVVTGGDMTTWSFSVPNVWLIGFGGTFDTTPAGSGQGIDVYADFGLGWELAFSVPTEAYSPFLGFIADTPFTAVQFRGGQLAGSAETYTLEDLSYAGPLVPEPMTLSLIGAGLVGLGLLRRRLRK